MFCAKCGKEFTDDTQFCPNCGKSTTEHVEKTVIKIPTVMLDPAEVVEHKNRPDSSKSFSGQGRAIGIALMIISVILDVVCMGIIGFDAFIPVTIAATVLFIIGFLLRLFSN